MDVVMQKNYLSPYDQGPYLKYKPCLQTPVISTLDDLIRELYVVFESDSVNVEFVHQLMSVYKSNPIDWKKFAKFDRCRLKPQLSSQIRVEFQPYSFEYCPLSDCQLLKKDSAPRS
jgi:hypothetical protein